MSHEKSQITGRIRPVVVTPTYNNAATVAQVLAKVEALALPIIIVNDGCTDDTEARLRDWLAAPPGVAVHVVRHERNCGKAAALRSGFAEAARLGYSHAVTIDTDGQHDPADIPALLAVAAREPDALVLGERSESPGGAPKASLLGRHTANLGVHAACGLRLRDSQCGLRVYPLQLVQRVPCRMGRYAFESEIITRAAWAGWPVWRVPVKGWYAPRETRVSHFQPLRDTLAGMWLQARLVVRALCPWPHRTTRPAANVKENETPPSSRDDRAELLRWLRPASLWEQARKDLADRTPLPAALGVGVLVACLPVFPLQVALALFLAWRLHLHPIVTAASSLIAFTPAGPALMVLAIHVGHLCLRGRPAELPPVDLNHLSGVVELWRHLPIEWVLGSLIVGIPLTLVTFFVAWWALTRRPRSP